MIIKQNVEYIKVTEEQLATHRTSLGKDVHVSDDDLRHWQEDIVRRAKGIYTDTLKNQFESKTQSEYLYVMLDLPLCLCH